MIRSIPSIAPLVAVASVVFVACGHFPSKPGNNSTADDSFAAVTPLPVRDESVSFRGPGSSKVAKDSFPAIRFAHDSYILPENASPTLDSVASHLQETNSSAILAGFTEYDEENRMLGEQRALTVRQALISRGADPNRLQTVSYGHDLPASENKADRRVEFGIVSPDKVANNAPVADTR